MAYQSLYRRYRSQKFSEVRGQAHVTSALRTAVAENRYGHAYLFSGPRGTGKTSTARILAKALNCPDVADGEPCGVCESCVSIEQGSSFDLHELDAASHNKVDDVRDLISRVNLGSPGRTKVYILDEVHMLSSGAENALLKTLEEPPDHVVFVLATTEPHKVVSTIRSRTQHFEFHLLPADELTEHVRWIIDDADLDVDDSAIDYVLAQGGGSARDTLSALDLVAAAGGVPAGSDIGVDLVRALGANDPAAAIAAVQDGLTAGQEPRTIGETTVDVLRNAFLASMGAPLHHLNDRAQDVAAELAAALGPAAVTRALEAVGQALVEMRQAPDPRVPLEVALLRLTQGAGTVAAPPPAPNQGGSAPAAAAGGDPDLTRRVAELERLVADLTARLAGTTPAQAGGTPAPTEASPAPAPPQPAGGPAPVATTADEGEAAQSAPQPTAAETPPTPAPEPPAAEPASEPAGQAADKPTGPAAAARSRLAEVTGQAPGSGPDVDPAAAASSTGEPPPPPPVTPRTTPSPPAAAEQSEPTEPAAATTPPADQGETDSPPADAAPPAAADTRPDLTSALTLSSVTDAFPGCLEQVSQKTRVRFKGGRILAVEGSTVSFGVPTDIHRSRCQDVVAEVAEAVSGHFGHPVQIDVVVDGESAPPPDPAKIEPAPAVTAEADEDIGPVEELADATDQSANGVERLAKAFPGSRVIDSEPDDEKR